MSMNGFDVYSSEYQIVLTILFFDVTNFVAKFKLQKGIFEYSQKISLFYMYVIMIGNRHETRLFFSILKLFHIEFLESKKK